MRRSIAVPLLLSVVVATLGAVSTSTAAGSGSWRMSTIPASMGSLRSPVEIRVAVRNTATTLQTYTVEFYADAVADENRVTTQPVVMSVAPGAFGLARAIWTPAGPAGPRTLHYRARSGGVTVASGSRTLEMLDVATSAPPYLSTMWIEPGHVLSDVSVTAADVRDRIDEMHALRMDTIVVAYVEYEWNNGWGPFYPSSIEELGDSAASFDVIGAILEQAARNGQHVLLGLGRGPEGPLDFDPPGVSSEQDMDRAAAFGERVAEELTALYGHLDSLYGWYISHEANTYSTAKYFYDQMARRLDRFGPEKPVLIAPAGTPTGIDAATLAASDVDIFAYQDAVGPGYVGPGTTCRAEPEILGIRIAPLCRPYTYTWKPYNRIGDLDWIFDTYRSWHAGTTKHIWSDLEIWQMDGPLYAFPYAATCERVRDQIEVEAPRVTQLSGYEFFGYMRAPENHTAMPRAGAAALYDGYARFVSGETARLCG